MLDIVDELKQKLSDLDETPQGHIVLGTTTSIAIQILPRVLSYFQDQFPLIKTSIQSMPSSQIYTLVESGLIDIGIGYLTERNPNLNTSVLYYDTFELIVSPAHPLAKLKHASVDVLRDIPLILLSPDTVGRKFTEGILKNTASNRMWSWSCPAARKSKGWLKSTSEPRSFPSSRSRMNSGKGR